MNATLQQVEIASRSTDLGAIAIGIVQDTVAAVAFGHRTTSAAERDVARTLRDLEGDESVDSSPGLSAEKVLDLFARYADGEAVDFSGVPLYPHHRTRFQQSVVEACQAIPRGKTRTYGELAAQVGKPGAARAVGTVMSSNPLPLVIPCHRVLAAGGGLGGYSARQGVAMKRRLLDMEGADSAR